MRARRLPVLDLYVADDECVVFVGDQVIALSSRATAALLSVEAEWTPEDAVMSALVAALGDPPAGLSLVATTRATLDELERTGLVELDK
jgi:hypothetical protein